MKTVAHFLLAFVFVCLQAACGSRGSAACDRVKTYCSVSDQKDKDCRDAFALAERKACEASLADFTECLVDNGAKCTAQGELEDDIAACSAQKNAANACLK